MEKWLHEILGSYQAVDVFLSPSDFLIKKYHELGFKRAIRRIHHPLLSEPTQQGGSHLPWSDRPPISLFFGRLSPEKGVDTILRALPLVPERKLEIVGFGPSQSELEKLVTDLHLENRVTFIGPEYGEALAKRMARAKEIIVPAAWYENQPFVLMDSLRSGTPVLASAIGGIPDIIRDGENGFLFAPGDPNDLAKKIRSLSEFDIEKITQEAYRTASDYTPERYVQEILTAYKDAREQRKIS
ncbi:MAG: glycosyltransferase [Candidatus Moraniibacteriota bacterium]|nr:MAG: glycosyltransferase [Candidatus Moranbacteria bacterium]